MYYKVLLYTFNIMISIYALSAVKFDNFLKPNKAWESRILYILTGFILGYLFTNFVVDFLECSKIF